MKMILELIGLNATEFEKGGAPGQKHGMLRTSSLLWEQNGSHAM